MRPFEYASPATREQAIGLLSSSWGDAEVLAGGADLIALMKDEIVTPRRLVNIKEIHELKGISFNPGTGLRIGALVTIQEVLDSPAVKSNYRALAEAAEGVSSPQIQNMGTIGGNLCQRPRCWYFRTGFGLLAKDENGESLVPKGDNRYHAILGNDGPAYFVSPSTLAPSMIAFGAKVRVFGPGGQREIPLEKFFVIPGTDTEREHDLKPNEIVTEVLIPPPGGARSSTLEIRQRESHDWPLAMASVVLNLSGGRVVSSRIVMGHVAPVPWLSPEASQALEGKAVNEETAQAAGNAAVEKARSLSRNKYKIQLARIAVKRAILLAARGGQK